MNEKEANTELIQPKLTNVQPRVDKHHKNIKEIIKKNKIIIIVVLSIIAVPSILMSITFIGMLTTRVSPFDYVMFYDLNDIKFVLEKMDISFLPNEEHNENLEGLEVNSSLSLDFEFEGRKFILNAYAFSNQGEALIYIERASGVSPIKTGDFFWIDVGVFFWRQYNFISSGQNVMHIGGSNLWSVNRFLSIFLQELRIVVDSHENA